MLGGVFSRARLLARAQPLITRGKDAFVRYSGSAPSSTPPKNFLEAGQIDGGFFQGTAMLAGAIAASALVPFEAQLTMLTKTVEAFRYAGLSRDAISDDVLLTDYLRKNALAAQNVLIASPTFYFLFSCAPTLSLSYEARLRAFLLQLPRFGRVRILISLLSRVVTHSYSHQNQMSEASTLAIYIANAALRPAQLSGQSDARLNPNQ